MAKTLTANVFSVSSLRQLRKELEKYRDSLPGKLDTFMGILLDEGITVAQSYAVDYSGMYGTHKMAQYVSFDKEINTADGKIYGILYGRGDTLTAQWYVNNGSGKYVLTQGTINTMLAMEFGTAAEALPPQEAFGVTGGRGTNSKYGHANDSAWYIITGIDENGKPCEWKLATAMAGTRPMYQAGLAMYQKVKEAARIAFGS